MGVDVEKGVGELVTCIEGDDADRPDSGTTTRSCLVMR